MSVMKIKGVFSIVNSFKHLSTEKKMLKLKTFANKVLKVDLMNSNRHFNTAMCKMSKGKLIKNRFVI